MRLVKNGNLDRGIGNLFLYKMLVISDGRLKQKISLIKNPLIYFQPFLWGFSGPQILKIKG